jgi:hypothetical protein
MNGTEPLNACQASVDVLLHDVSTPPFPSPRPSPSGIGRADSRARNILDASILRHAGSRFSLSRRERAGVRGNRAHSCLLSPIARENFEQASAVAADVRRRRRDSQIRLLTSAATRVQI